MSSASRRAEEEEAEEAEAEAENTADCSRCILAQRRRSVHFVEQSAVYLGSAQRAHCSDVPRRFITSGFFIRSHADDGPAEGLGRAELQSEPGCDAVCCVCAVCTVCVCVRSGEAAPVF